MCSLQEIKMTLLSPLLYYTKALKMSFPLALSVEIMCVNATMKRPMLLHMNNIFPIYLMNIHNTVVNNLEQKKTL